jgi:hypothetical protein
MDDDQGMSIDPVAIYAAVVATGALGWQVYQWRSDRSGRLEVTVSAGADATRAYLIVTIYNSNGYPVRLDSVRFLTTALDGSTPEGVDNLSFKPYLADIPDTVPAHDSVSFIWDEPQLERHLPGMVFDPAYSLTVTVTTSLDRSYSATAPIDDITPL